MYQKLALLQRERGHFADSSQFQLCKLYWKSSASVAGSGESWGIAVLLHAGMEKGKKTPEPWSSYRGFPGAFSQTNAEKAKLNTQLSAA